MRIYMSASHSCGKSTLARYVSEKYNLPMISETARMVLSEQELQIDSLRADLNVVNKYQTQVFNRQILEEQKYTSFVSDRSIIDTLAYAAQHSNIMPQLLHSEELKTYLEILKQPDSFIFFIRPSKATMKADGVRETLTWDGMVSIDAQIKILMKMFELRYFQIDTDNMQERAYLIDSVLSIK